MRAGLSAIALLLCLGRLTAQQPAQQPAPQPAPQPPAALLETRQSPVVLATAYQVESTLLGQTRRINVYLPPGYAESDSRYPVLYLLDGGVGEDFLHIAGIAALAADFRGLRKLVVVGIEGIDRRHDLTPPSQNEQDRLEVPTHGGSETFRRFLAEELKPWAEGRFRLTGESVLIGESLAGLFVAETMLRQPELFTGYICVSPSLWWNDQELARRAQELVAASPAAFSGRRIYLTIADEGAQMREGFDRVVAALESLDSARLELTVGEFPGEAHGTIFHPAALAGIRKLFRLEDDVVHP